MRASVVVALDPVGGIERVVVDRTAHRVRLAAFASMNALAISSMTRPVVDETERQSRSKSVATARTPSGTPGPSSRPTCRPAPPTRPQRDGPRVGLPRSRRRSAPASSESEPLDLRRSRAPSAMTMRIGAPTSSARTRTADRPDSVSSTASGNVARSLTKPELTSLGVDSMRNPSTPPNAPSARPPTVIGAKLSSTPRARPTPRCCAFCRSASRRTPDNSRTCEDDRRGGGQPPASHPRRHCQPSETASVTPPPSHDLDDVCVLASGR